MILRLLPTEDEDDDTLMLLYEGFYLQISFSELHPLLVMHFVREVQRKITSKDKEIANRLNQQSVLGGHSLNAELGFYSYRTAHWLDAELTEERFLEILHRSLAEAQHGFANIAA